MTINQHPTIDYVGNPRAVGSYLRRLREAVAGDESIEEFAHQFGADPAWITAIELGEVEPTLNDLHNFGHAFGLVLQIGFRPMTTVRNQDEIPDFASEEEEVEWWCTHQLGDEFRSDADQDRNRLIPAAITRVLPHVDQSSG